MKTNRRAFVLGVATICLLLLASGAANAQLMPPRGYLFVEVKDEAGHVVDDATVTFGDIGASPKTNKEGVAEASGWLHQSQPPYELQVSKQGYLTSEHVLFQSGGEFRNQVFFRENVFGGAEVSADKKPPPIRVTLYRVPTTPAERDAVEAVEQRRRFLLAVKRRNVAGLRQMLAAGARADTTDSAGVPAIAWAAFAGEAEAIKLLLDAGADVRYGSRFAREALLIYLDTGIDRDGRITPDNNAVARREEVVRRLLVAGATVNSVALVSAIAQTPYLEQPPHSLTAETIKLLIAAGADVNAADEEGQTPLMFAVTSDAAKAEDVVKTLLDAGAKPGLVDKRGRTALTIAREMLEKGTGHPNVVSLLEAATRRP